ncbi:hypothetical protein TOPH_03981 [Tolypocladium ophioglossoides CBS 100239]|uniref:Uncharacterized protein n=1 Tax=Tolypocladium ophioglossoides (strain CBS 100239) TaxID=1163406 RepID=A0A0L0NAV6_TOLOC|nr:hypothetical protein TOPH_03981 [Tolypocladium ophioglossoides CBS 100239]
MVTGEIHTNTGSRSKLDIHQTLELPRPNTSRLERPGATRPAASRLTCVPQDDDLREGLAGGPSLRFLPPAFTAAARANQAPASSSSIMASPTGSQAGELGASHEGDKPSQGNAALSDHNKLPQMETRTPEPQVDQQSADSDTPSTPGHLAPFDWDDFEARYEKALHETDEHEREILKEAESLSKVYFQTWASAASAHDDERAVKRLRTRQRFVNLSEEKAAQKQQHYEEVVRAFESALALLQAK